MEHQIWTVEAWFRAPFMLPENRAVTSPTPLHPSALRLLLEPVPKDHLSYHLAIDYLIEAGDPEAGAWLISDLGKDLISAYLDLLAVVCGAPVKLQKPPDMTHRYPSTHKFRRIFSQVDNESARDVVPLPVDLFVQTSLTPVRSRMLGWFRKGMSDQEILTGVFCLFTALEILSQEFVHPDTVKRACEHCKMEIETKPGPRQLVLNLMESLGYPTKQSEALWGKGRNALTHGRVRITAQSLRDLHEVRAQLVDVLTLGIRRLLGWGGKDLPSASPLLAFSETLLDTEYLDPFDPSFPMTTQETEYAKSLWAEASVMVVQNPANEVTDARFFRNPDGEILLQVDYNERPRD